MGEKTIKQQAWELGVSPSYLSQVRHGKRPASKKVAEAMTAQVLNDVKQAIKQNIGGSAWESNPPGTGLLPPNGVEVRGTHRDPFAPVFRFIKYNTFIDPMLVKCSP
jgi:hypothetical protein